MKRIIELSIVVCIFLLIFPSLCLSAGNSVTNSSLDSSDVIILAQLNFGDVLKALTDDGSDKKAEQPQKQNAQEPQPEDSRLQRRLKLLEGVGTLLSSSKEIDYESERTIGESLALEGFNRYGLPVKNNTLQTYINLVGTAVARNSLRPGIPYRFVVVESPLQNAFSCPGGIIFLSSGLLKSIRTEAQLACVLAHEVGHVGHKHALKSIQRARFFEGIGKITATTMKGDKGRQYESMIGDLQTTLFDRGLDKNMEFEADMAGMETAYRTGYDPSGMLEVLQELQRIESKSQKAGSWFSTHPPLDQRIERCMNKLNTYPDHNDLVKLPQRYVSYIR
jgi:beta-barrel assembly-enhancing protease